MKVIGIDPGQKGAVAILHRSIGGEAFSNQVHAMPDTAGFVRMMRAFGEGAHIFIEKAQSFPKQGVASAFNYGQHFGELLGVIYALGIRHTLVRPGTWTKAMHAGTADDGAKKRSLEAAQRLFPGVSLLASERAKKPHDGFVDALLLAEYGCRQLFKGDGT